MKPHPWGWAFSEWQAGRSGQTMNTLDQSCEGPGREQEIPVSVAR